jgi:hypothetical protein
MPRNMRPIEHPHRVEVRAARERLAARTAAEARGHSNQNWFSNP